MPPLPRSLDPISGESLVSYLLRLSHRLSLPPLHLARMAGLTNGFHRNHISRNLLLDLTPSQREAFGDLARLSAEEVTQLTLSSLSDRYPPIARSLANQSQRTLADHWLFLSSPRFCTSCLAGEATATQRLHGGAWRKAWHLPVIFACVRHEQFLEPFCRHCGWPDTGAEFLIPRVNDNTLHPAQCRWTSTEPLAKKRRTQACGGWLNGAASHGGQSQPTVALLRFQEAILTRLSSSTPAAEAAEYFTDLRVVAALVSASWPHARYLVDTTAAEKVDVYVRGRHGSHERQTHDALPRDPIACATVLQAADHALAAEDLSEVLSRFIRAAFQTSPSHTPWSRLLTRHEHECSERLREAAQPVTRAFRKVGGSQGTRAPIRDDYQPEHIPAFLEHDWYQRHLARFSGHAPKFLRRVAAVQLVQWSMGGSQSDAASFLGINPSQVQFKVASEPRFWAQAGCDPTQLDAALRELASELGARPHRFVDYQRRRKALRNWALDRTTWIALINEMPPLSGSIRPDFDDRKRQEASVFVWTQVTQGEHLFAPRTIAARQPPDLRRRWAQRRSTTWFQLTRPDPLRHYADLRKVLSNYARQLTADIDSGTTPAREAETAG
ncbi:TniQ family protein [Streptomyces sp. NBC_01294]|uniref:TniQ family protein n=1 Tax=Streptomyces sp. NBC_01294 TaxID=2903815 RepID=UPI002DDAF28F|nr:TniQ family protein [Streptomyces sp. NBC_01294]WRZ62065.1 TniQ family protein [Streptomyces sp. NBC_01294]